MAEQTCYNVTSGKSYCLAKSLSCEATPPPTPYVSDAAMDARFLMQATFGPTRKALSELMDIRMYAGPNTYVNWLQKQMQLPYSSHRAYARARMAPQVTGITGNGEPFKQCDKGARWVNYAFHATDTLKEMTISGSSILLDGEHVSDIDPADTDWSGATTPLKVKDGGVEGSSRATGVKAKRGVGQTLEFETTDGTTVNLPNPAIYVDPANSEKVMDGSKWTFNTITVPGTMEAPYEEVLITLAADNATCREDRPFLSVNGKFYRMEKRLKLYENTLEVPAALWNVTACPTVKRNYFNAESCVMVPTCSPAIYTDKDVT
jgi:hypothetical protein